MISLDISAEENKDKPTLTFFLNVDNRYTMLVLCAGAFYIFLWSVLADIPPCYGEFTGSALLIFKLFLKFKPFFCTSQHKPYPYDMQYVLNRFFEDKIYVYDNYLLKTEC